MQMVNLVQNNGEPAGQTVFHFICICSSSYKDDHAGILWEPGKTTPEEMEEIKKLVNED